MRSIPVDVARLNLLATGKVSPKAEYVTLSDGSSRRSGNQATTPDGTQQWTVDCLVDDEDAMRSEVIGVSVASHVMPAVAKFRPVAFYNVVATVYRDQMTGQPK